MKVPLLLFAAASCLLLSCSKPDPQPGLEAGALEGHRYQNAFFGFSVDIPESWSIQSQDTTEELTRHSAETFEAQDERTTRAVRKAVEERTRVLLAVFEHELGTPVQFNPSILIMAEQLELMPGIKRGSDYHFHARALLSNSNMGASFPDGPEALRVASFDCDIMPVILEVGGLKITQLYHTAIARGYALNFILSYETEEQLHTLREILATASSLP